MHSALTIMKTWILSLSVLLAVAYVSCKPQQDKSDYQAEVLKLYQGIGNEDTHDFVRKGFPFADTKYYKEPKVVEKFVTAYKDGFLDKEGHFSLYSYKNRHDTYRLFDLFYFAKDFETFAKIAKWAKQELNPLQFVYAFTAAIYQRKDTEGVLPPPFYEVLPSYFTPSDVMFGAYKSMIHDVKYRKFEVNGTGYEYSWYKDQPYDAFKYGPKYNEFDTETRMAYYREDVGFNDWYTKFFLNVAPWLSDEKYPDITWERRGELMYNIMKFALGRYNLERYSNGLPPVEPINYKKSIKTGYNSHMADIQGRPFLARADGLNPYYTNPAGVEYLDNMFQRYLREVDAYYMYNPLNGTTFSLAGIEGFETFTKIFFGISHPEVRKFYRPLYYQALETLDSAVKSSNDVGYTGSPIGNYLTELRDPAFYQVLAYLDRIFHAYNIKKKPYTKDDIKMSGVKISSVDFSKFETFFERYEYDISNGVPSKSGNDKYKYLVSKYRMNHKPYSYKIQIQSDKDVDATVKFFVAPKFDSNYRPYGFNGFTKYGVALGWQHVKLKSGSNVIEFKSTEDVYRRELPRLKHIMQQLQRAQEHGESFTYPCEYIEAFPSNLALPRGSKEGTYFQSMFIVQPRHSQNANSNNQDPSTVQLFDNSKFLMFPFDRPISEHLLDTPNVYFSEFAVYDVTKY